MPNSARDPSRLARAIQLGLAFRASGRADREAFLAQYEELRDLLEPILDPEVPGEAEEHLPVAGDASPGLARSFGGYLVDRELGRGGMGTVYLARQAGLGRQIALKVLSAPTLLVGERSLVRFQREAKVLAALDHPAIVRVLDAGVHEGLPYFAMELVRGASLAELLAAVRRAGLAGASGTTLHAALLGVAAGEFTVEGQPGDAKAWSLPNDYVDAVVTMAVAVAEALAFAHAAGVVHRDVKPSNILVRHDGRAVLADFGVAREDGAATLTATGDLAGTPTYMAPEQLRGGSVDGRTDLWALGVSLYEALTLQLPFVGETPAQALAQVLREEAPDPRRGNPAVGRDLAAVVGKALAKEPERRYATAAAMAGDLRAVLVGAPTLAQLPGPVRRTWSWMRREPWRAAAAVLVTSALAVVFTIDRLHAANLRAESTRLSAALAEAHRLAIGVRLDRALVAARPFRARIEQVPAMEAWLREHAEPLAAELPRLETMLAELRREALPYGPVEALADRNGHPQIGSLGTVEGELVALTTLLAGPAELTEAGRQDHEARLARLRQVEAALREQVSARRTWRFADLQRQFLHDQVTVLVGRLQKFLAPAGLVLQVQKRVALARDCQRRCIEAPAALWREVAADISADPRFRGLQLRPQRDLVPLGKDPRTGLWEFVHMPSGKPDQEMPTRSPDHGVVPSVGAGIVLVLLPGGTFACGAQRIDPDEPNFDPIAKDLEGPVHEVTLAPFFLGKYEITRGQWLRLAGERPSTPTLLVPEDLVPVDLVSHEHAREVLADFALDLPTESQWEYGCRAGTDTPRSFGERAAAAKHANFAGANVPKGAARDADIEDDGHVALAAVGTFAPNALGLHDMHGNVEELTADRLARYGPPVKPGDGAHVSEFDEIRGVVRGGMNQAILADCRSSWRGVVRVNSAMPGGGMRAARRVEP